MTPGSLSGTLGGGGEPTAVNCENRARKLANMNFNHSYANSTTEDDEERGDTLVWKSLFGASASALYLLVLAVNAGIVHYEREAPNPQYRTLADRLAAASSAYNVLAASGAMPQAVLLETVYSGAEGGLGAAACRISQFMILSGFLQVNWGARDISSVFFGTGTGKEFCADHPGLQRSGGAAIPVRVLPGHHWLVERGTGIQV